MQSRILLMALAVLLLSGSTCADRRTTIQTSEPSPSASSQAPEPTEAEAGQAEEKESDVKIIEGKLAPTVEAGGWILSSEEGTYLLLNYQEYRKESWFREGAQVRVWGQESPDTVTIFMQGMPFKVEKMEPVEE